MTADIFLVLAVLAATVILLVTEILRVDVVAVLVLVAVVALELVSPNEAIAGFANPATVTVAAMFILSAGLQRTGAVNTLARRLIQVAGDNEQRLRLGLMGVAALLSAFINNTAAVAVLIPLTLNLSQDMKVSPSRLLMPLSFAAMFGGVTTLIGTSTNILVSAIASERGLEAFSMFEFAPMGLIFVVAGIAYMMTIGRRLIPDRRAQVSLVERYELREYLTEVVLRPDSPLVGQTVEEAQLGLDFDINIVDIIRDEQDVPVPAMTRTLQVGDILIVSGNVRTLVQLMDTKGWKLHPEAALGDLPLGGAYTLAEAVIAPGSSLVGETLRSSGFRRRYGTVVLGIEHHGRVIHEDLANLPLEPSDVLLLYGERTDINTLAENRDFLLLQELPEVRLGSGKAPLALAIVIGVIALAALEIMSIVIAAILGCVLMVLTRILTLEDAYDALNAQVLVMLAGILSLSIAMEETGTATYLANLVVDWVGPYGPYVLLSAFYLMTSLLTETMSNTATAALLAPIVISIAAGLDVNAKPFLVAVAFAASASFMTPIGYQTNTMIYGPGGYRFADFTRVGAPLNIFFWIIATLLIPVFWPF